MLVEAGTRVTAEPQTLTHLFSVADHHGASKRLTCLRNINQSRRKHRLGDKDGHARPPHA